MPAPVQPELEPGRVYRTREFARWTSNPSRLAQRLVRDGQLVQLGQGMFAAPQRSRFGALPPTDEALMSAFLDGAPFVFTGPDRWNALGLGTTAVFARPLVYNTKRSGKFTFAGREFLLRRVAFPTPTTPEWFVIDLFENADQAGASADDLTAALRDGVRARRFDRVQLGGAARRFGSRRTQRLVDFAMQEGEVAA